MWMSIYIYIKNQLTNLLTENEIPRCRFSKRINVTISKQCWEGRKD